MIEHFQPGFFWPIIGVFVASRAAHAGWAFFSQFVARV